MKWSLPAVTLLVALTTAACGEFPEKPEIRTKLHPKMRHEITLTLQDAPGPFDTVEGSVFYKVADSNCVPMVYDKGSFYVLAERVPVALMRVGDSIYKGEFFTDFLVDEDYFGKGSCHWVVGLVTANLRKASVMFSPSIDVDPTITYRDDMNKSPITRFFPAEAYWADDRVTLSGYVNRADIPQESKVSFSATLGVEEKLR